MELGTMDLSKAMQLGKQLHRPAMVVLELGMESGPITMVKKELDRAGGMIGVSKVNKMELRRAGQMIGMEIGLSQAIGLIKLGHSKMLQLGMETGPGMVLHGTGKMTMKAAKLKAGQKTGLMRFGPTTGTKESEGMTHLPSMASGMPSLGREEILKGWSGTSSASALGTTGGPGLGDCMHLQGVKKKLGHSHGTTTSSISR